jgi:hypothetical protein
MELDSLQLQSLDFAGHSTSKISAHSFSVFKELLAELLLQ